jgi:hypothetical protein
MRNALEHRIAAAERRLTPPARAIEEICIFGGMPFSGVCEADKPATAGFHACSFERQPNEPFVMFRIRVKAEAVAANAAIIVYGGLPDCHNGICTKVAPRHVE